MFSDFYFCICFRIFFNAEFQVSGHLEVVLVFDEWSVLHSITDSNDIFQTLLTQEPQRHFPWNLTFWVFKEVPLPVYRPFFLELGCYTVLCLIGSLSHLPLFIRLIKTISVNRVINVHSACIFQSNQTNNSSNNLFKKNLVYGYLMRIYIPEIFYLHLDSANK